jgi:GTP-binding protein EngB required for normal cell division
MDKAFDVNLAGQLGEDLGWLEAYCRQQPGREAEAGRLLLAAALVRNCLGPYLREQPAKPLHIVVVGGAGTGKSTVVNFLVGSKVAEANPQAGFTRHPTAFAAQNGPLKWTAYPGFLGALKRLDGAHPGNVDQDVYQVRPLPVKEQGNELLEDAVIWDCPDMTTWASTGYLSRLMEVAALADVLVFVASDERYNDEVPTQFLELLLQTGKPVIVCLTKMNESQVQPMLDHFRDAVLGKLGLGALACLAIPNLTPAQMADLNGAAARYRIPLLNQVAVLGVPAVEARRRVIRGAAEFLRTRSEALLAGVRRDMEELGVWQTLVSKGQVDFDNRYRTEYLTSEKFHGFDDALLRLLELLELPGVGKVVSGTLWVLRTPYRLAKTWLTQALTRPDAPSLPEMKVLNAALDAWLDRLRKEALKQGDGPGLWKHVAEGFQKGLVQAAHERFDKLYRTFQLSAAEEVQKTAQAIYEELEKKPVLLNSLRSGNFALDLAAIGSALTIGHLGLHDVVLVPLMASIKQQIVELLGKQYVDNQREQIRHRQQLLVTRYISTPMSDWLAEWPATGGSTYEHLKTTLTRVPEAIEQLDLAIVAAAGRARAD